MLYNSDVHRLRRADVQYTSPPTMLFTIGLSERAILVIRLKIDLRITQVQELTLSGFFPDSIFLVSTHMSRCLFVDTDSAILLFLNSHSLHTIRYYKIGCPTT